MHKGVHTSKCIESELVACGHSDGVLAGPGEESSVPLEPHVGTWEGIGDFA